MLANSKLSPSLSRVLSLAAVSSLALSACSSGSSTPGIATNDAVATFAANGGGTLTATRNQGYESAGLNQSAGVATGLQSVTDQSLA